MSVIYRFIPRHGRTSKASIAIRETRPSFSAGRTHTSTTVPVTGTACMSPLSSYNHFIPLKKQIFLAPDLKLDLVDSTRAGERLPDAPSKTVPIWCATNNRATQLCGLVEAPSSSSSSSDIAVAVDFNFNMDPHCPGQSVTGAPKSPRGSTAGPRLSQSYVLPPAPLPVFVPSFPAPPARANTHTGFVVLPP